MTVDDPDPRKTDEQLRREAEADAAEALALLGRGSLDTLDLIPCPRCGSLEVERHYARQDGGVTWPGCLSCEATMPLEEWTAAVAQVTVANDGRIPTSPADDGAIT